MAVKDCCQRPENLRVITHQEAGVGFNKDTVIKRCAVCQCRHFEMSVDPIPLGVAGASIGG